MAEKKNLFLYLPSELHRQIKTKAAKEQVTLSATGEALFTKWVEGEIKLEHTSEASTASQTA